MQMSESDGRYLFASFWRRVLFISCIIATAVLVDQFVKFLVVEFVMQPPRVIELAPFFDLVLVFNRGISFGMFSEQIGAFPTLAAWVKTGIVAAIVIWACRTGSRAERTFLSAMAGGALGNIADRFRNGAVTDYLSIHAGEWAWPAFNLADVFVVSGASAFAVWTALMPRRRTAAVGANDGA